MKSLYIINTVAVRLVAGELPSSLPSLSRCRLSTVDLQSRVCIDAGAMINQYSETASVQPRVCVDVARCKFDRRRYAAIESCVHETKYF